MILFRPVGESELNLIKQSDWRLFPPRLPEQPIFYPVLNEKYATEIAQKWNTADANSGFRGHVLKFEVANDYIQLFAVHTVGKFYHQELWIPAEELANFNAHIHGKIQLIKSF